MSAPAAKAFSLPVMTMAPICGSWSNAVERLAELADQRRIERIERLRPVEPDEAHGVMSFDEDILIGHGIPLADPTCVSEADR